MIKKPILFIALLLIVILLSSCVIPANLIPSSWFVTATVQGTPNATLTALFDTSNVLPTNTPPIIATVTNALPTVDLSTATSTATLEPTLTPTLTPTVTPVIIVVTATNQAGLPPASPGQRNNAQMVAMYLSTPPVQDGTYAEWVDKTNKYTTPYFAWGQSNWSDHADLEGAFALGWDDDNLYVGAKITDDTHTQNNSGYSLYIGDAVEILLDTNLEGDFPTSSLNSDDFQLGLSAGSPSSGVGTSAYLFYPKGIQGTRSEVIISTQFESSTIYRIEAAIPWSVFGVKPHPGMRMGFAFNVDDNDNVSDYKNMTMLSSASGLSVFNPTTWGELVLMK